MVPESLSRVINAGPPFGFCNPKAGVRSLHVASDVEARSAGQVAYLIDEQLPRTLLGIDAACRKAAEHGFVAQHSIGVVYKSRDYVIAAERW